MIRRDIEYSLELETVFLPNRVGIDPVDYRVGFLNSEILVLNNNTKTIMDYYYDDSSLENFDISYYFPELEIDKGRYLINRQGDLWTTEKNRKLTIRYETYPNYGIVLSSNRGHTKRLLIHRILAKIFIPNLDPVNKTVVDHKDRNKNNYSLNNLRWVDIYENAMNKEFSPYVGNYIYNAYKDVERKELAFSLTEEELNNHPTINKNDIRHSFDNYSNKSWRHCGYYWTRVDLDIQNYLSDFGIETIDDSLWKESYVPGVYVHPIGLVKTNRGKITLGSNRSRGYSIIKIEGIVYNVSHLIAGTFLGGNKPIEDGYEVDHISTNILDNRVENLRICTHEENMRNPITRKKLSDSYRKI